MCLCIFAASFANDVCVFLNFVHRNKRTNKSPCTKNVIKKGKNYRKESVFPHNWNDPILKRFSKLHSEMIAIICILMILKTPANFTFNHIKFDASCHIVSISIHKIFQNIYFSTQLNAFNLSIVTAFNMLVLLSSSLWHICDLLITYLSKTTRTTTTTVITTLRKHLVKKCFRSN